MTVDILRRDLRQVRTLAFEHYDRLEATPDSIRNRLAMVVDNRSSRENPVRLQEDFFFPEVYGWEDEVITLPGLDQIEFSVPMKGYSAAIPYNEVNIGRPDTVARIERLTPRLPIAYHRVQTRLVMEVFRRNSLTYDGQSFFDGAHAHPGGKGTYGNILRLGFADPDKPTFDEVKDLIHRARALFVENMTIQAEVLDAAEITQSLTAIVHNSSHWSAFENVRTKQTHQEISNEVQGTFTLLVDNRPARGQENYIEFVLADPTGPRPAFLVIDKDPELDAWETSRFGNGYVAVGLKGIFGVKPGYPQVALQAQP